MVTPSYNQGQFIEETIRSVLLQGYPDLEYIIVDGGSTDTSLETISRYEPWLAYSVSEPDRGQTHAINKGWRRATGDIVAYINADDFYVPGAFRSAAQAFCAMPHVGMVYGTALIVDEEGRALRPWEAQPFDVGIMLTVGSIVPQAATFFSQTAVRTVGPLNEEWEMIMDYDFCIRVGMQFPTVCLQRTLAKFRSHADSKTRSRFDATARELIDFITTFSTSQLTSRELRRVKRASLSRVYYELALGYVSSQYGEGAKALRPLTKSIAIYPRFAVSRPILTAHITKGVLVQFLKALAMRAKAPGKTRSL